MVKLFVTRRALLGKAAIQYLLRDEFSDDRAAAVDFATGTPAVPGPGTRLDKDTNSKMSQVAGLLSFATGGIGAGDPGRWWEIQARTAGRVLAAEITPAGIVNASAGVGWDANQADAITDSLNFAAAAALKFMANGAAAVTVGVYVAGTSYQIRVVQRATGMRAYIKGGTYTNWSLLWVSAAGVANGYPAIGALGATAIFTSDYARIPTPLFTGGVPLASDSFNRGNGSLHNSVTDGLAVEEAGGAGQVWTAVTWTIAGNVALNTPTTGADVIVDGAMTDSANWNEGVNWSIGAGVASLAGATASNLVAAIAPLTASTWYSVTYTITAWTAGYFGPLLGTNEITGTNVAATYTWTGVANGTAFGIWGNLGTGSIDNVSCLPLTLASLFSTVPCSSPDVLVEVAFTNAWYFYGYQAGIVVNLDNPAAPANFIIAYLDGQTNCVLDEWVAGVRTNKISAVVVYAANAKLKIVRSGTSCSVYYNELQVGTTQTMTANTNVNHGMFSTQATPTVDNLAIWARGTNGEYAILDKF